MAKFSRIHNREGVRKNIETSDRRVEKQQVKKPETFQEAHNRSPDVIVREKIPEEQKKYPTFEVAELPSRFLGYPKNCQIRYRPFTYRETWNEDQSKLPIADRLENALEGIFTSFNKLTLFYYDFQYISLLRRLSTFNAENLILSYDCKECGQNNTAIIPMIEVEFMDATVPDFPIVISDDDGTEMHFLPLTIGNEIRRRRLGVNFDDKSMLLSWCCVNLPLEESYRRISEATDIDVTDALEAVNDYLYLGVKDFYLTCKQKVKNPISDADNNDLLEEKKGEVDKEIVCGATNIVGLFDANILVLPFRTEKNATNPRIRFGSSHGN